MKKHFVWTREIEQKINETLSDKSKRPAAHSDDIIKAFSKLAELSAHYYAARVTIKELSRIWTNINKSSIYRMLERNKGVCEGVVLIFNALELQNVLNAPEGSIIVPTFGIGTGGYSFEVIKPDDPNYREAFSRLPGAS
jgi:hypothetical protein